VLQLLARHAASLALVGVVAGLCTWPAPWLLLQGDAIVGHPVGDAADHFWGTAWLHRSLLAGAWPQAADGLFHPETRTLWHADPVGALLSLPLSVLGPARAWNALVLGQVFGLGLAVYAAGCDLVDRATGRAAALVAMAAPFLGGLVHGGLSEYFGLGPVALGVWALLRASGRDPKGRPGTWRWGLAAGLCLGLAGWQAPYYALFVGIFALSCLPGRGLRRRLLPLGLALGVGALITVPYAALLAASVADPASAVRAETAPGWRYARLPGTDLLSFVVPGAYHHPDTPALGNPGILHVVYLGWAVLLLAVLGLRGLSALRLPALLLGIAALGPRLVVFRHELSIGETPIPLPLALAWFEGSPFAQVHHPYRLVAVVVPLLALLAGAALARRSPAVRVGLLGVVLVEALVLSPAPWPRATLVVTPPALYASLPAGGVLDWPADGTEGNRRHVAWQVSHGRAVPYGLNEFLPEPVRRDPLVRGLLRALDEPADRARNRDQPFTGPVIVGASEGESQLATWGYGSVVLHPELLSEGELSRAQAVLRAALGDPTEVEGRFVYVVPRD